MLHQQFSIQDEALNSTATSPKTASKRKRLYTRTKSLITTTAPTAAIKTNPKHTTSSLSPPPKFAFVATCSNLPRDITVGQHLEFTLSIARVPALCAGGEQDPEIHLDACILTLTTQVPQAPAAIATPGSVPGSAGPPPGSTTPAGTTVGSPPPPPPTSTIEVLRQTHSAQRPAGPFAAEHNFAKTLDLGVFGHVRGCTSGGTGAEAPPQQQQQQQQQQQGYALRLELRFYVAGTAVVMRVGELPVRVHPLAEAVAAGVVGVVGAEGEGEEVGASLGARGRLPSYDEAVGGVGAGGGEGSGAGVDWQSGGCRW